jgi:hypothetical protein
MKKDSQELTISGDGIPPYTVYGTRQTLSRIAAATQLHRTANGKLIDLSPAQFKKYQSTVTLSGALPDFAKPGQELMVDCACELSFKTAAGSWARPAVEGSLRTESDDTFYRPRLKMLVTNSRAKASIEDGRTVQYCTLELDEV